jgi:hypothetical protein
MKRTHGYAAGQVWRNLILPHRWFLVLDTEGDLVKISEVDKQVQWLPHHMLGDCYELLKEAE